MDDGQWPSGHFERHVIVIVVIGIFYDHLVIGSRIVWRYRRDGRWLERRRRNGHPVVTQQRVRRQINQLAKRENVAHSRADQMGRNQIKTYQ